MSIGNQEFGIPSKYQYQIGVWDLCLKFLCIFLVFYRNLEYDLVKSWFNIGIFRQNKNWSGIWLLWLHFIGIGLVSVCHFPENGISSSYVLLSSPASVVSHPAESGCRLYLPVRPAARYRPSLLRRRPTLVIQGPLPSPGICPADPAASGYPGTPPLPRDPPC